MAEYRSTEFAFVGRRINWGAIWGGVFCFIAICTVFGALGVAIFARSHIREPRSLTWVLASGSTLSF